MNDEGFVEYDSQSFTTIEVIGNEDVRLSQQIQSEKVFRKRTIIKNAFHLIFSAMLMMGIPIQLMAFKSKLKVKRVKVLCYASLIFKLVTMVFAFAYAFIVFPDYSTVLSYYAFSMCGDLTILSLVLKRKKIYSAIRAVARLSSELNLDFVGSRTIQYEVMTCVLISTLYMLLYVKFFFYEQWDIYLEMLHVPFGFSQANIRSYTGIVITSVFSYTIFNVLTCIMSFILLYNAFLSLANLVESFNGMILEEKPSVSDSASMKKYIVLYGEIFSCVQRVDDALNACCFFMLGTVVGSFFAAVSVTFSGSDRYQTFGVKTFVGCTLVGGPIMFLVITITASRVVSGYRNLKAILLEWSETMERYLSDPAVIRLFAMFADNVRKSNLAVTGCRMFAINKGLILTVGGTVITYSFLLFQLDYGDPSEQR